MIGHLVLAALGLQQPHDSDGDGLSDYLELTKYCTDPRVADSDGDGVLDGEWLERREFTYSVRVVLKVLSPVSATSLSDRFQDGRVLEQTDSTSTVELIIYPLVDAVPVEEFTIEPQHDRVSGSVSAALRPSTTVDWSEGLSHGLRDELKRAGIDAVNSWDSASAAEAASYFVRRARQESAFTTFYYRFVAGVPVVIDEARHLVAAELSRFNRSLDEQLDHEMFGSGMVLNRRYGTCTSASIYISTCMRAVGIPTRSILCVPVIDPTQWSQVRMVKDTISYAKVRDSILAFCSSVGDGWTSHTLNEVFIEGQWRRLNYATLDQSVIDSDFLGLMACVNRFTDFAESGLTSWGRWHASAAEERKPFSGGNPYSCIDLSECYGPHMAAESVSVMRAPPAATVSRMYWYHDSSRPPEVRLSNVSNDESGHVLLHVDESSWMSYSELKSWYHGADKGFVLRSQGYPSVRAAAQRGYWYDAAKGVSEFYVHIEPREFRKMVPGQVYTLYAAVDSGQSYWRLSNALQLVK